MSRPLRLPQLSQIAFGILQACKAPVGIRYSIDGHLQPGCLKLRHHCGEIPYSKVDHPDVFRTAKVGGVGREWLDSTGTSLLVPWELLVVSRRDRNAQMLAISLPHCRGVLRAEEYSANASNFSIGFILRVAYS